ncbi:MAG: hypothetical protein H0T09_05265 [Actinobacteria bacterium]|nr:hypothetical protein [Actinomycetota bacterium]
MRGGHFAELIARQLALFEAESGDLIQACDDAERAYDRAARDEAEERYGEVLDLVETATDRLAELRDSYAEGLDDEVAEQYRAAFDAAAAKRFPRFAAGLEES